MTPAGTGRPAGAGSPSPRAIRIDAHQHYWRLDRGDYGWLTPAAAPIYRDLGPEDLRPALERAGIDRTVLVQAAPTVAETGFLLDVAARTASVAGVVGWAPLDGPEGPAIVHELAGAARLKAIRPMIHDLSDPDWVLGAAVGDGLRAVAERGLAFDALVRPVHLPRLLRVLGRHPDLRAVVDHCGKPEIAAGRWEPWAGDMRRLARETGAWVKLSGLVTEAGPGWTVAALRPYVEHVLEHFGPARTIFGSDWPVMTLRATYAEWVAAAEALLAGLERPDRDRIMGGNAGAFYRL